MVISGKSSFVALLGHPVTQVRSPEPINEWFAANQVEAIILPMDVHSEQVPTLLASVRGIRNCIGLSVTVPHKQLVAQHVDALTERARAIGAVNIVRRSSDGRLLGDMVDGIAMTKALTSNGVSLHGARAAVVGAGGAGLAILHALGEAGVASLVIIEIDLARRAAAASSLARSFPQLELLDVWPDGQAVNLVINASTLGMREGDPFPVALERLRGVRIVADVVTKPTMTPWLEAARSQGHKIQLGEEMTLAQIPIQLDFWGFRPSSHC